MSTKKWVKEHQEDMRRYRRDYYYRNKQEHYDRNKKTQDKIKKFIAELKSTLKCSRCPENDSRCLDFHHENPEEKVIAVSWIYKMGWCIEKVKEEISKCMILCSNCHRKEHTKL